MYLDSSRRKRLLGAEACPWEVVPKSRLCPPDKTKKVQRNPKKDPCSADGRLVVYYRVTLEPHIDGEL
jgi:hypothetical protein